MNNKDILQIALKACGADAQTVMVFEEMTELQKEMFAEEIADVQIMLEQMIILHDCEDEVMEYKRSKIERLKIRLGIGNESNNLV